MNELKEHSLKEASELAKASQDVASLSEEELNAPVDEVEGENIAFKSCDCRSEYSTIQGTLTNMPIMAILINLC